MRVWMMGTGPFAVPTFRWLLTSQHEVVGLMTQPQRETKPGQLTLSPMRQVALDAGLAIHDPANVNSQEGVELLRSAHPDLLVVCDYGQILKPQTLATARLGGINLHGSLLPKYRGAAPVNWAMLHGERETGVTVIHMTPRLDAGPCLVRRRTAIEADQTAVELEARLAELGVEAVRESMEMLEQWDGTSPLGEPQNPAEASRAPRLTKNDGWIDWQLPAEAIKNRVRGLVPWPGTFTQWINEKGEPQRLIIRRVAIAEASGALDGKPGDIFIVNPNELLVLAGDGRLVSLLEVQPAGKKSMSAGEFLRGYRSQLGQRFGGS